jgi:hypothetical protein
MTDWSRLITTWIDANGGCLQRELTEKYFVWESEFPPEVTELMDLSRKDASAALDEIDAAERRARQNISYREASPFLILWGVVWLLANTATDLLPGYGHLAWPVGSLVGTLLSLVLVVLQLKRMASRHEHTSAQRRRARRRALMIGITLLSFFVAMHVVLGTLTGRQYNAFISLFWAFAYMAAGTWLGVRIFVIGLAVAILAGYLFIQQYFLLWMAIVGGGSLLLAGFWLRRT